jgi:hypothetical protein
MKEGGAMTPQRVIVAVSQREMPDRVGCRDAIELIDLYRYTDSFA